MDENNDYKQEIMNIVKSKVLNIEGDASIESVVFSRLLGFSNIVNRLDLQVGKEDCSMSLVVKTKLEGAPNADLKVNEDIVTRFLGQQNFGPRILYQDHQHTIEDFEDSNVLSISEFFENPSIFLNSIKELGKFLNLLNSNSSKIGMENPVKTLLSVLLSNNYHQRALNNIRSLISNPECKLDKHLLAKIEVFLMSEAFSDEVRGVVKEIDDRKMIVCHNDFYWLNVIKRKSNGKLMLIDYEYTGYNPIGWDLVNSYCERNFKFNEAANSFEMINNMPKLPEREFAFKFYILCLSGSLPADQEITSQLIFDVATGKYDDLIDIELAKNLASFEVFTKIAVVENLQWILFNCNILDAKTKWPITEYTSLRIDFHKSLLQDLSIN